MYRISILIALLFLSINIVDAQVAKPTVTKTNITQQSTKPVTTVNTNTQIRQQPLVNKPVQTVTVPTVVRQTSSPVNITVKQPVRSTQTNSTSTRQPNIQVPYANQTLQQTNKTTTVSQKQTITLNTNQQAKTPAKQISNPDTNSFTHVQQPTRPVQLATPANQWTTSVNQSSKPVQLSIPTKQLSTPIPNTFTPIKHISKSVELNTPKQSSATILQSSTPTSNGFTSIKQTSKPFELSKPKQLNTPVIQTSTPVSVSTPVKQQSVSTAISKPLEPSLTANPTKTISSSQSNTTNQIYNSVNNSEASIKKIYTQVQLSKPIGLSTKTTSNQQINKTNTPNQLTTAKVFNAPKDLGAQATQLSTSTKFVNAVKSLPQEYIEPGGPASTIKNTMSYAPIIGTVIQGMDATFYYNELIKQSNIAKAEGKNQVGIELADQAKKVKDKGIKQVIVGAIFDAITLEGGELIKFFKEAKPFVEVANPTETAIIKSVGGELNTYSKIGSTGKIGEDFLKTLGGESQKYFGLEYFTNLKASGGRYIDQFVNGIAYESKVGYTTLTKDIQMQIAKDAELLLKPAKTGVEKVVWYFFKSPVTGEVGASQPLLNELKRVGIEFIIEVPK